MSYKYRLYKQEKCRNAWICSYCIRVELLRGKLFTSREFRLRTNLVRPNYKPTYLTTLYITETIVINEVKWLPLWTPNVNRVSVWRDFSNFLIYSSNIWLLVHHKNNRVGQARVLFYLVYIFWIWIPFFRYSNCGHSTLRNHALKV